MIEHYAESVAIGGMSPHGEREFDIRLARFPALGTATLWLSAYIDGIHFAAADASLVLAVPGVTPVAAPEAVFEASGVSRGRFESTFRGSARMHGRVSAATSGHRAAHVDPGSGPVPMSVEADIDVLHEPVMVRPGRMEVMGHVRANLDIAGRSYRFDVPGKWHEQTGPRRSFGPPFTYMFLQGSGIGLMTSRHPGSAYGYALRQAHTTLIRSFEIDDYGTPRRSFTVQLADGTGISGTADVLREVSVPIEGQRRPGATVRVTSELGEMVGHLNDWRPENWNQERRETRSEG